MTQEICGYDNRLPGEARIGNWMQTWSGRRFWPLDPRPEEVFIEDIAAALGKMCRFAGHCHDFYSVAEHSVHVSHIVPQEHALLGLLHDATEAYCVDVPRPLKRHLQGYAEIEANIWRAIATRFDVPVDLPPCIKVADNAILLTEQQAIMAPAPEHWNIAGSPADRDIRCYAPGRATMIFAARFEELTGEEVVL